MVLEDQAGILVQGQNEGMNTVTMERGSGLRLAAKIALFLCIIVFLIYGSRQIVDFFAFQMWPRHVGMSKMFPFPKYLLMVSIAILPGPIFFLVRDVLR